MSNLESLNNKELRAKCMEYGLPNVPVTNSSRKLLIRRLEAAMSDKSPAAAQTKRRETTNVSKQPQITSSPKITINKNNETTIKTSAVKAAQTSTKRQLDTTVNDLEETTGISPKRVDNSKDKATDKSNLYPKLPAKEPSPKPRVLGRTSIVTTTSVQESNKNRNKGYAESQDIDSVEDVHHSTRKYTTSNLSTLPFNSGTQYSSLGSSSLSYSYSSTPSTYTTTSSSSRTTYAVPSLYRYDGDSKVTTKIYEVEEASDNDDDVVVVEDSNERKGIQTPFVSSFARNLESLKKSASQREGESIYSRGKLSVTGGAVIAARRSLKDAQGLDRW